MTLPGQARIFFEILPRFTRLDDVQIFMDVDDKVIDYLNQLPHLEYLDVSNTRMTGDGLLRLKRLLSLKNLECSTLDHIDSLVKKLSQSKLEVFKIETVNLQPWHLKEIGKIKTLGLLSVAGNQAIDDKALLAIGNLLNLYSLHVQTCSITGKSANFFKRFKKLNYLSISDTNWTAQQIAALRNSIPASIDVRGNRANPITKEK